MKQLIKYSVFLVLSSFFSENILAASKDQLLALDARVDDAFFKYDNKFLANVLTSDFIWVHAGAYLIQNKAETLTRHASPARQYLEWPRSAINMQLYDNTAIVSGFISLKMNSPSLPVAKFHIQRVYINSEAGWKLAAQHSTFVSK